jgi:tetratricopeptide (TPR) repeat protein
VLVEWDFDGDGAFDANRTDGFDAGFTYAVPDFYLIRVQVTREANGTLGTENATRAVTVLNGWPDVKIDAPDRAVATVPQRFLALATDPDEAEGGEPFTYRWSVNGEAAPDLGSSALLTVPSAGLHTIRVEATDAEGQTANATLEVEFASPGPFEGRGGTINFSLMVSFAALALGAVLVRARERERRARTLAVERDEALVVGEAVPERLAGAPPKQAFAGASGEGPSSAPRIVLGGAPAALQRTRECPVCHNAVDADNPECPFCKANAEADLLEARLEAPEFAGTDLSEVRALLQRARRQRHLGRLEEHRELLAEAGARAQDEIGARDGAVAWVNRARDAFAKGARERGGERVERAESYLKLAESLFASHQNAKAARHAKRALQILEEQGAEVPESDRCAVCGGAIAAALASGGTECEHCGAPLGSAAPQAASPSPEDAEAQVRAEIKTIRGTIEAHAVEVDEETWKLLEAAEAYENRAQWSQALEMLRALRDRFEREARASKGAGDGAGPDVPPPST